MPDAAGRRIVLLAAIAVAVFTAVLYRATMLPGLDLGDSPSFQTMGGSTFISPRDAYPLYFAFGMPFVWAAGDPAFGMNLASAAAAALACGGIVLLSMELVRGMGGSLASELAAALAASLIFAGTFTFWSQAVTTEVYSLHIVCIVASLTTLLAWERQPTIRRLASFLLVYALSFGNHLTMVLLLPGVLLVLASAPGGGRRLLTWRHVGVASACIAVGASLYLWNLRTLVLDPLPPAGVAEAVRRFWFDVTKADWRDTMMLQVPRSMAGERGQMFLFDLQQQFALPSLLLASVGALALARHAPRRFLLLLVSYIAFTAFALTYSVGDTHVFLLPGHLFIALAIAPGLGLLSRQLSRLLSRRTSARWPGRNGVIGSAPALVVLALAGMRLYQEYPSLDRSQDHRARRTFEALAGDLHDAQELLIADMDWQLLNGLNYYANRTRRDLLVLPLSEVLPYLPTLVADNQAIGRSVYVTAQAARRLQDVYGPLFEFAADPRVRPVPLVERVAQLPSGSRYVLCVLKRSPETPADADVATAALRHLAGGRSIALPAGDYVVVAGVSGRPPERVDAADGPFRVEFELDGLPVHVRFDAWLRFDTIRRMGFGQVIAGRHHGLIVERGISFVALDPLGRPQQTAYADGLYAPLERLRLTLGGARKPDE